jgi:hypothetical protein
MSSRNPARDILGGMTGALATAQLGWRELANSERKQGGLLYGEAVCGEDTHGIWINGIVNASLTQEERDSVRGVTEVAPTATKQFAGLRQAVTFGRTVTFLAQKLRHIKSEFEEWYSPLQSEMANDPLLRYFNTLRTTLLKEGLPSPIRVELWIFDGEGFLRNIRLPDPPVEHLGLALSDIRIATLLFLYLDYLHSHVVEPAKNKFGDSDV